MAKQKMAMPTKPAETEFKSQEAINDAVKAFAQTSTKDDVIEFVRKFRKTIGLKAAAKVILGREVEASTNSGK